MRSPFTKSKKLRVLRKGDYNKLRAEWKKHFGLTIPTYKKYKEKVKAEKLC